MKKFWCVLVVLFVVVSVFGAELEKEDWEVAPKMISGGYSEATGPYIYKFFKTYTCPSSLAYDRSHYYTEYYQVIIDIGYGDYQKYGGGSLISGDGTGEVTKIEDGSIALSYTCADGDGGPVSFSPAEFTGGLAPAFVYKKEFVQKMEVKFSAETYTAATGENLAVTVMVYAGSGYYSLSSGTRPAFLTMVSSRTWEGKCYEPLESSIAIVVRDIVTGQECSASAAIVITENTGNNNSGGSGSSGTSSDPGGTASDPGSSGDGGDGGDSGGDDGWDNSGDVGDNSGDNDDGGDAVDPGSNDDSGNEPDDPGSDDDENDENEDDDSTDDQDDNTGDPGTVTDPGGDDGGDDPVDPGSNNDDDDSNENPDDDSDDDPVTVIPDGNDEPNDPGSGDDDDSNENSGDDSNDNDDDAPVVVPDGSDNPNDPGNDDSSDGSDSSNGSDTSDTVVIPDGTDNEPTIIVVNNDSSNTDTIVVTNDSVTTKRSENYDLAIFMGMFGAITGMNGSVEGTSGTSLAAKKAYQEGKNND
jgi:hypothetical protein